MTIEILGFPSRIVHVASEAADPPKTERRKHMKIITMVLTAALFVVLLVPRLLVLLFSWL